jgi:Spy/CpxP family protein refolding chaperone
VRVPMTFLLKTSFNLILAAAAVTLGATTLSNAAQAAHRSTPQTLAQAASPSEPSGGKPKIVLTEKQRAQIESIRKNENSQIIAVLTPEQKTLIQQAAQSNKASGSVEADLKLTEEQKTKIVSIQKESRKQIESVLTPEQLQILQKQPTQ